jgi:hypothetical protein
MIANVLSELRSVTISRLSGSDSRLLLVDGYTEVIGAAGSSDSEIRSRTILVRIGQFICLPKYPLDLNDLAALKFGNRPLLPAIPRLDYKYNLSAFSYRYLQRWSSRNCWISSSRNFHSPLPLRGPSFIDCNRGCLRPEA